MMTEANPQASRIWCFDATMLDQALEALYEAKAPQGTQQIHAVADEVGQIRCFLYSELAARHKLTVQRKRCTDGQ